MSDADALETNQCSEFLCGSCNGQSPALLNIWAKSQDSDHDQTSSRDTVYDDHQRSCADRQNRWQNSTEPDRKTERQFNIPSGYMNPDRQRSLADSGIQS